MRSMLGLSVVLVACGGGGTAPGAEVAAPAEAVAPVASAPAAPAVNLATGMTLGIVYAGNVMGELEPCG